MLINHEGWFDTKLLHWLERQRDAVLLETTRLTADESQSLLFTQPAHVIHCRELANVIACLHELEHAVRAGYYVAGFLAYEAGYAFEKTLSAPRLASAPLLWFGVYEKPVVYDHHERRFTSGEAEARHIHEQLQTAHDKAAHAEPLPSLNEAEYAQALVAIKNYIAAGDTYQVNFTFKLKFAAQAVAQTSLPAEENFSRQDACATPQTPPTASWYQRLRQAQRVSYAAFLALPEQHILSFSPELFFRWEEERLTLRPMKGTARRGRTTVEDEEQRLALLNSKKDRAENVMIVDLLRNDAGRIAEVGSVRVPRLFEIERYETVLQATSTITARVRPEVTLTELLRALFPCGSITGAPKLRTMQIIHELEREPRGVYTGAIGYFAPQRKAVFSVAIRTLVFDQTNKVAEMGIGSGVVWDSVAEEEYRECLLKARFLTEPQREFELLETMRWERTTGCALLPRHLQRLRGSAKYFGFQYDEATALAALHQAVREQQTSTPTLRVRLTLNRRGECEVQVATLESLREIVRAGFAQTRTHSHDRFLFHKTTRRELYESELAQAQTRGWFDALFLNERGEVTEGARSNIIIKRGEQYFTPPLACGVLPGVYRAHLLATQALPLTEKIILREELETAEEVWLCNALRGMLRVELKLY